MGDIVPQLKSGRSIRPHDTEEMFPDNRSIDSTDELLKALEKTLAAGKLEFRNVSATETRYGTATNTEEGWVDFTTSRASVASEMETPDLGSSDGVPQRHRSEYEQFSLFRTIEEVEGRGADIDDTASEEQERVDIFETGLRVRTVHSNLLALYFARDVRKISETEFTGFIGNGPPAAGFRDHFRGTVQLRAAQLVASNFGEPAPFTATVDEQTGTITGLRTAVPADAPVKTEDLRISLAESEVPAAVAELLDSLAQTLSQGKFNVRRHRPVAPDSSGTAMTMEEAG